jgi:hypothetical protein
MKLSSIILLNLSILVLTSADVFEAESNTVSDFRKETLSPNVAGLGTFTHPIVDFIFTAECRKRVHRILCRTYQQLSRIKEWQGTFCMLVTDSYQ